MAKVYLDANYFIDLIEQRKTVNLEQFNQQVLYLSPLSIHIYTYLYKQKCPNHKLYEFLKYFSLLSIDEKIACNSLIGPTKDFEDNLQLHSAADNECDYFLTHDKNLLNLSFFGKMKIVSGID